MTVVFEMNLETLVCSWYALNTVVHTTLLQLAVSSQPPCHLVALDETILDKYMTLTFQAPLELGSC